jgi:methylase of polypeptide subunit release factors
VDNNYLELTSPEEVFDFNQSEIPHNKYWDTGDDKELKIHRIHAYPAKFPAFITTKALSYAVNNNINVGRLADIFCGCGTSAFEARRSNIDFWGCDLNPVATLIARTKSASYDPDRLGKYLRAITEQFATSTTESTLSHTAIERLNYWFPEEQFQKLSRLLNSIHEVVPKRSKYRDFFICAFSNILKVCSRWLQKSIKPQVDPHKTPADPILAFKEQVDFMIKAYTECRREYEAKITISNSNFLKTKIDAVGNVDMIVTSPPYVTSYEYADLHQLSSLWLGFADDYRTLRDGSIGSSQHDFNFNRESKRLNTTATQIVFGLYDVDPYIAKSVAKYYLDMQQVASKCNSFLNEDGAAVFVIGNTHYKNVYVDNSRHLAESLLAAGFAKVSMARRKISNKILTPYRDANGRFTKKKSGRKIYSDEFVLIATRQ